MNRLQMVLVFACCYSAAQAETLRQFLGKTGISQSNEKFVLRAYVNAATEQQFWRDVRTRKGIGEALGNQIYFFCFHPELLGMRELPPEAMYLEQQYSDYALRSVFGKHQAPQVFAAPQTTAQPTGVADQSGYQQQLDEIARKQRWIDYQQRVQQVIQQRQADERRPHSLPLPPAGASAPAPVNYFDWREEIGVAVEFILQNRTFYFDGNRIFLLCRDIGAKPLSISEL